MKTLQSEIRVYRSAIILDRLFARGARRRLLRGMIAVIIVLGVSVLAFLIRDSLLVHTLDTRSLAGDAEPYVAALFFLIACAGGLMQLIFYHNTLYFRGLSHVYGEEFSEGEGVVLEVASLAEGHRDDLTRGFLSSTHGAEVMTRLGIGFDALSAFVHAERAHIHADTLPLKEGSFVTPVDVGVYLMNADTVFAEFLFKHSVTKELFLGANAWVWRMRLFYKKEQRWWARDALGKINGLGQEFSFGGAYMLRRWGENLDSVSASEASLNSVGYMNECITRIETVLTRTKSANVILVGDAGVGKLHMLAELNRRIREGHSVASLLPRRFMLLGTEAFVAAHGTKADFEHAFLELMNEAESAGNIIVVIRDLPAFIKSVEALGSDVSELLERFLDSSEIQIVGTTDPHGYHEVLEPAQDLLRHFEPIIIDVPDAESSISVLEGIVWKNERRYGVIFTYPALVRIVEDAEQYLMTGTMPDKAINLLSEIAARSAREGKALVAPEYVDACVEEKSGVPVGPIGAEEREFLMNLEETLQERVVGQEHAVHAISETMRRARTGLQSKDRPIGSFLFLGTTGVGKTETAKALAHTFFKDEERMVRFDMSEYSGDGGLARLIGDSESTGTLSKALTAQPYCVLLLDEFEKSDDEVRDLFLQILDEGLFTDNRGKKINLRNSIIIATSNAGSDHIWSYTKEGKNPDDKKEEIIDALVKEHVFKPELLNRFDSVIFFEVLDESNQHAIASMMLKELENRVRARGYGLEVSDRFLSGLVKVGYDPKFGARPMRRAIQNLVEGKIARKILEGKIKTGDTIHFDESDLN